MPGCGSDRTNWVNEFASLPMSERHYCGRCSHCCRAREAQQAQRTQTGGGGMGMEVGFRDDLGINESCKEFQKGQKGWFRSMRKYEYK